MCELLGMSANVPTDICFSFTGLVQRGGGTGPHKDGWGITFYEGKGCRTFKDPQPSFQSPIAKLVQEYLSSPARSSPIFARLTAVSLRWKTPTPLPVSCGDATGPMRIMDSSVAINRWKPEISVRSGKPTAKKLSAGCSIS